MRRMLSIGVALFLAVAASAFAQTGTEGAILGVVTDQSQGVVPGAEVVVQNEETGIKRTVKTNDAGIFEVLPLPNGRYSVSVTAPGFKSWQQAGILLRVGERMRVSPNLEVGHRTEQVMVAATTQLLQTDSVETGGTVEANQIRDLPLNGRNPLALVGTVPGLIYVGYSGALNGQNIVGNGMRPDQTRFQLDGLAINDTADEGALGIPSLDSIAEFSVQSSTFTAESGTMPMQVLMASKSGTNAFHGVLYEFVRNNAFDARNTFALSKPKLTRNQFGGAVGGPIIKNRTFFFFSLESTRIRGSQIYNETVAQPAMLDGYFTNPITNPYTGDLFPQVASGTYAGMYQIPADLMSSASTFLDERGLVLMPNNPDGRYHALFATKNDTMNIDGRIDHQITGKQRITGRWNWSKNSTTDGGYVATQLSLAGYPQQNVALNYTYNITPTVLLTLSAGYLRGIWDFSSPEVGKENLTDEAGIQGFPTAGRENAIGMPDVGFEGYTGYGEPWGTNGKAWTEGRRAKANVILLRGKHTVNLGYEFETRSNFAAHSSFAARGSFYFSGQYTGDGFADYLLGLLSDAGRNYPLHLFGEKRVPYSGLYAQDAWNITPKLTLNYGVRFDYWHEKTYAGGQSSFFDINLGKVIAGCVNGQVDLHAQPVTPYLAAFTEGLWVPASEAGWPCGTYRGNGYVSPRLGIAWRPTSKGDLVIRGGYGIYPSTFVNNIAGSSGASIPFWSYETPSYNASSFQRWETVFPAVPNTFNFPSAWGPVGDIKAQRSHTWNISVQKELPLRSALTVSYVGNHVFGVISGIDYDEVDPAYLKAHPGADLQASRPFPQYSMLQAYDNMGDTWYNAMDVKWERRFTQGLSFTASYAYSKLMADNAASDVWESNSQFAPAGYNRVISEYNRTHIMGLNWIWELPVGHGRKYMSNANRAADAVLGGWELTGLYKFTSGDPLAMWDSGDALQNGWGTRADQIGNPAVAHPNANEWFNPAAFANPEPYTYGNSFPGVITGPGFHGFDVGLLKHFRITESTRIQFRWELFNAVNHVNLRDPETTVGIEDTGHIYRAGTARQMQFGLKFIF